MLLSFGQVLCLPMDVYSVRGGNFGLDMDVVWNILYISTAVYLFFIGPFFSSFYEADEDDSFVRKFFIFFYFSLKCQKFKYAFCYLFAFGLISNICLIVLYGFFGVVN